MKINEITEGAGDPGYGATPQQKQLAELGRVLMDMAVTEKDDDLSNKMARLGDEMTRFGTAFGAKNLSDIIKKTGLEAPMIQSLLGKAQQRLKTSGPVRKGGKPDDDMDDENF
jgi:hypothetical protein